MSTVRSVVSRLIPQRVKTELGDARVRCPACDSISASMRPQLARKIAKRHVGQFGHQVVVELARRETYALQDTPLAA